jgi:hypothetical protein
MDNQFTKRLKSLMWRAGMMALATFVSFLAGNFQELGFSPAVTGVLGLVLGEVSKYLNTKSV